MNKKQRKLKIKKEKKSRILRFTDKTLLKKVLVVKGKKKCNVLIYQKICFNL